MSNDKKNNNSGFELPADYFEHLTDRVMNNVNKASQPKKDSGFRTPDGYFEGLTDRIMTAVEEQEAPRVIPLKAEAEFKNNTAWLIPVISIAAIGLLLFSIQNFWGGTVTTFDTLEDQEVMDYVVNMENNMDQEAIDLLFSDNDILDEISVDTQIKEDELLDYLMDEVDLNQIYTE